MKKISGSVSPLLARGFAAILLGCVAFVSVAGTNGDATVHTVGGVSYVSGGVGTASIDRLNALASGFNLKLVFAGKSGAYLADVKVNITDSRGRTLLDITSEGPWLLAKLPTGNYRISASFAGNTVKKHASISTEKLRTVDFRWASD
jgi:hypothetical protein